MQVLTKYPGAPVINQSNPEAIQFLNTWYNTDNIFKGRSKKISYENNYSNFSIKTSFNGPIMYVVDGNEKLVEPGTFLVINKNIKYACYIDSPEEVEDISLQFTNDTISDIFNGLSKTDKALLDLPFTMDPFSVPIETISFVNEQFGNILTQMAQPRLDTLHRDELKTQLVNLYFTNYHREQVGQFKQIDNENAATKFEIFKRVHTAKDFLHSNYTKQIDLNQVARAACISPSHLIRKFNEVLKTTPYQYLRKLRLEKAVYLLKKSNLPVEQITTSLGFECPSSFIRTFRQTYHTTPNAFRKQFKITTQPEEEAALL